MIEEEIHHKVLSHRKKGNTIKSKITNVEKIDLKNKNDNLRRFISDFSFDVFHLFN